MKWVRKMTNRKIKDFHRKRIAHICDENERGEDD